MSNATGLMQQILEKQVPTQTVAYCFGLWQKYQFDFKATRPRNSKLGDFRFRPFRNEQITVNANLNPYNFLITYLHEVAHLEVHKGYKRRQPPHGKAWKTHFRNLLLPVMNEVVFPNEILQPLLRYAQNPKARTGADVPLMTALRKFDNTADGHVSVAQLQEGQAFRYQQKIYQKSTTRRTRAVCIEQRTQKKYLFSLIAMVEKV